MKQLCLSLFATLLAWSASAAPIAWTARAAAQANTYTSICWSPALSLFCAVSPDGASRVMTSPDGVTWTARNAAAVSGWISVCWSPELSLFCAVAQSGATQVMTSPDGVTWTGRTAGAATTWRTVIWAKELSKFCAVAASGALEAMTSPDGITWTAHTAATTGLIGLCWAPELGLLVAGGGADANRLMTSPDGATWTSRTAATFDDWLSIAWSPTLHLLVAVADTSNTGFNKRVMTSPDGINWTSRVPPEANDYSSVCWSPELGLFCAVSNNGTNRVMTSADGITWTMGAAAAQNFWYAVCWSPALRRFAAVSWDGASRVMTGDSRTFYIDYAGGSDAMSGVTTSEAWKRAPGMTGFAATYTHAAGDRFIFKGGVTWPVAAFPMTVVSGGASGARDLYTSDTSWYSGASWSRPTFDFEQTVVGGGGLSSSGVLVSNASYITFDALELKRHRAPVQYGATTLGISGSASYITITNCVVRDWDSAGGTGVGSDAGGGIQNFGVGSGFIVVSNVLHQANTANKCGIAIKNIYDVSFNEIYATPNAILASGQIHHNHLHDIPNCSDPSSHPNAIGTFAPSTVYANLIHDLGSGVAGIFLGPDWSGGSSIDLVYNNTVYNCGFQAPLQLDTGGANPLAIGLRAYNNTLEHGSSMCIRVVERSGATYGTLDARNNHLITTSAAPILYNNPAGGGGNVATVILSSNLVMTPTAATLAGYTSANAYRPTATNSPTVRVGVDLSAYYTVDRLDVYRPIGLFDVGAYQQPDGVVPPPPPPPPGGVRLRVRHVNANVIQAK